MHRAWDVLRADPLAARPIALSPWLGKAWPVDPASHLLLNERQRHLQRLQLLTQGQQSCPVAGQPQSCVRQRRLSLLSPHLRLGQGGMKVCILLQHPLVAGRPLLRAVDGAAGALHGMIRP
jgi:hypothetical protein